MKPTLYFNFAGSPNYLDTRISFVRNSVGSYVASNGYVAVAPANAPRWTFHPTTGECLGIIIEGESTNRVLYSESFDNAAWTENGTCSVGVNAIQSPDGSTTADRIEVLVDIPDFYQTASITSGKEVLTYSIFAKADVSNFILLSLTDNVSIVSVWFDLVNKSIAAENMFGNTVTSLNSNIESFANGWSRCSVTVLTSETSTIIARLFPCSNENSYGSTTDSIYVWGAQLEDSPPTRNIYNPTSYIPTTSAAVTRSADNYYISIAPATDTWFNSSEGSLFYSWSNLDTGDAPAQYYGGIGDSTSNYISLQRTADASTLTAHFVSSTTETDIDIVHDFSSENINKAVIGWNGTSAVFTINAAVPTSTSTNTATPATTTRMTIGFLPTTASASSACAYATIRSFAYFRNKLDNTNMMLLTS